MSEQRAVSEWTGVKRVELSPYVSSAVIRETKEWVSSLPIAELRSATFLNAWLYSLCRESFRVRARAEEPLEEHLEQEQLVRRLLLQTARAVSAWQLYLEETKPSLVIVAGGQDFITMSALDRCAHLSIPSSTASWDSSTRSVVMTHPTAQKTLSCEVLFEEITELSPDPSGWPEELRGIVRGVASFLGIGSSQLFLPNVR